MVTIGIVKNVRVLRTYISPRVCYATNRFHILTTRTNEPSHHYHPTVVICNNNYYSYPESQNISLNLDIYVLNHRAGPKLLPTDAILIVTMPRRFVPRENHLASSAFVVYRRHPLLVLSAIFLIPTPRTKRNLERGRYNFSFYSIYNNSGETSKQLFVITSSKERTRAFALAQRDVAFPRLCFAADLALHRYTLYFIPAL